MRTALLLLALAGSAWAQSTVEYLSVQDQDTAPLPTSGRSMVYADSKSGELRCSTNGGAFHKCTDKEIIAVLHSAPISLPKPEPMDVEPVKTPVGNWIARNCLSGEKGDPKAWGYCFKPTYTCANKLRVLLTDEGGGKHCILFPKRAE